MGGRGKTGGAQGVEHKGKPKGKVVKGPGQAAQPGANKGKQPKGVGTRCDVHYHASFLSRIISHFSCYYFNI